MLLVLMVAAEVVQVQMVQLQVLGWGVVVVMVMVNGRVYWSGGDVVRCQVVNLWE